MPIIRKDSPYSAPFSSSVSFCLTGIRHLFFRFLRRFPDIDPSICMPLRNRDPRAVPFDDFFSHSMSKTAEKYAFKLDPDIDHATRIHRTEQRDAVKCLDQVDDSYSVILDSSNLAPEPVKQRRLIICTKAIELTSLCGPWWILRRILLGGAIHVLTGHSRSYSDLVN
jgi:hypothetical protein